MKKINSSTLARLRKLNNYEVADLAETMLSYHTGRPPSPAIVQKWIDNNLKQLAYPENEKAIKEMLNIKGEITDVRVLKNTHFGVEGC